jgi:hypothetical protein
MAMLSGLPLWAIEVPCFRCRWVPSAPCGSGWIRIASGLIAVLGIGDDRQVFVLDLDQLQRRLGDFLRLGGHGGDFVALAADAADLQREVILGDADRALVGNVGGGDHHMHAGQGLRRRGVDRLDQGVDAAGAQDLAVQLARTG